MTSPSNERDLRRVELALKLHWAGSLVISELDAALATAATNFQQVTVLAALAGNAAHSPAELARLLRLDPAAITRVLNRLEARLFIARSHGETDRRTVRVNMTPAGRIFVGRVSAIATGVLEARFAHLTREEFDRLAQLLMTIMTRPMAHGDATAHDDSGNSDANR